mmetsp:Transcript_38700/g.44194  ORF Transcript_38700/g.44194 Transcript_38700/m.44194 type:complete len:178 (+) Transcript_38700:83-616(+)
MIPQLPVNQIYCDTMILKDDRYLVKCIQTKEGDSSKDFSKMVLPCQPISDNFTNYPDIFTPPFMPLQEKEEDNSSSITRPSLKRPSLKRRRRREEIALPHTNDDRDVNFLYIDCESERDVNLSNENKSNIPLMPFLTGNSLNDAKCESSSTYPLSLLPRKREKKNQSKLDSIPNLFF